MVQQWFDPVNVFSERRWLLARGSLGTPKALAKKQAKQLERRIGEVRERLTECYSDRALRMYQVAKLVLEVKQDEKKYGTGGVDRIAESLGLAARTLYEVANVAKRWTDEEFEELRNRLDGKKKPLSWTHLVKLAGVDDDQRREELINEGLNESLSFRELRERIKSSVPDVSQQPEDAADECSEEEFEDETAAERSGNEIAENTETAEDEPDDNMTTEQSAGEEAEAVTFAEQTARRCCETSHEIRTRTQTTTRELKKLAQLPIEDWTPGIFGLLQRAKVEITKTLSGCKKSLQEIDELLDKQESNKAA